MSQTHDKKLLAALEELPLFPLPKVVLFPRALLPLHVFEPRYQTMLRDCLETHRAMAVVLMAGAASQARPGAEPHATDIHGHPPISTVASVGTVVEHQPLEDGRSNILLSGIARVRLEELPFVPPYRRARATILEEHGEEVSSTDRTALVGQATAFAAEVKKADPMFHFRLPPDAQIGTIADLCAHHLVVDASARQAILEELDIAARVQRVIRELALQQRLLGTPHGGVTN
ncbi:LON peptidase substrate-binding domain-containing protein [Pendulispora brunnea]|uniref:LON peptidase substrate-binding domain-containing protein n=1 Tax=Pendulispora brunnea TaxID=2905690 RepID=A0ABZ2KCC7_9BACT